MSSNIGQNPAYSLWATCDEILSCMIGSDSDCITIIHSPKFFLQGMTNNAGLTISVDDTLPQFTISIEQDN